jgi:hypothetical protein
MTVIGLSAGAAGRTGNVDRMVQWVLERWGEPSQFVKLTDLSYSGCRGCAELCRGAGICPLKDDLEPLWERIEAASAVVIGSPVRFDRLATQVVALVERFFGFRHRPSALVGKPFLLVTSGARPTRGLDTQLYEYLKYYDAPIRAVVHFASGQPPCSGCREHPLCRLGADPRPAGSGSPKSGRVDDDPLVLARLRAAAEKFK